MAIPNTVANGMISGVIGEISHNGPTRVTAAVISSADETKNLFGRAYTYKDDSVESVQVGGDGAFAGIMINPKAYRIGEEYARNGTQGEFLTMGEINAEITAGVKKLMPWWCSVRRMVRCLRRQKRKPVIWLSVLSAVTLSQRNRRICVLSV